MKDAAMTDLTALVALSLLPISIWRLIGAELRAGAPPADILDRFLDRWPDEPERGPQAKSRAAKALARAAVRGITPIGWNDRAYPPALAAIIDPPPVLWMRGLPAALNRPA